MRALCTTLILAAAILPAYASAQPNVRPSTDGRWFLGVGISPLRYSRFDLAAGESPSHASSRLDLALGGPATLALGYGVLEVFTVELDASVQRMQNDEDEDDNISTDPSDPARIFDRESSMSVVTVGPTARLYLTRSMFQPFVEAGIGFGWVHVETESTSYSLKSLSARVGAGGQWRFADAASVALAVDVGFESTSGDTSVDSATLVPIEGKPEDTTTALREIELGGDTLVIGMDLRLHVWL
jgi:opacity protein-like surface antigen